VKLCVMPPLEAFDPFSTDLVQHQTHVEAHWCVVLQHLAGSRVCERRMCLDHVGCLWIAVVPWLLIDCSVDCIRLARYDRKSDVLRLS
jgi:hypothetical protein